VEFSGRFSRRERATYKNVHYGAMPISTVTANIDYSQGSVILKNGCCGIKVWLYRKTEKFAPEFIINI